MAGENFSIADRSIDLGELYTPGALEIPSPFKPKDLGEGVLSPRDYYQECGIETPLVSFAKNYAGDLATAGGVAAITAGVILATKITIPALILAACGSAPPKDHSDKPLPFPEEPDYRAETSEETERREEEESLRPRSQNPQVPSAGPSMSADAGPVTPAQEEECVPDDCEGVIDYERASGDQAPCFSFEEVHAEAGLTSTVPHNGFSIADVDGNGSPDILVLNNGGPNQLFGKNGETFAEISAQVGLNIGGDTQDAAWADYDGDGDPDVLLVGAQGSRLYKNNGGHFELLAAPLGINDPERGTKAVWIGGGFLLGTENGTRFYHYNGGDQFSEISRQAGLDDPGEAVSIKVADHDGNGTEDIFVANMASPNRFFSNRGDGTYSAEIWETPSRRYCPTDSAWVKTAPELPPSLYITNFCGGSYFYTHQPEGFLDAAGRLGVREPEQSSTIAAGDFFNEGHPALFLGRQYRENLVFIPKAGGADYWESATPLGMATTGLTLGAQWFDENGDGSPDLLVMMEDGAMELHRNTSRSRGHRGRSSLINH